MGLLYLQGKKIQSIWGSVKPTDDPNHAERWRKELRIPTDFCIPMLYAFKFHLLQWEGKISDRNQRFQAIRIGWESVQSSRLEQSSQRLGLTAEAKAKSNFLCNIKWPAVYFPPESVFFPEKTVVTDIYGHIKGPWSWGHRPNKSLQMEVFGGENTFKRMIKVVLRIGAQFWLNINWTR